MPKRLSHYFPEAAGPHRVGGVYGVAANPETGMHGQRQPLEELSTRWRVVLSLEMQGMSKTAIAKQMGIAANTVSEITRDERYLTARDEYLAAIDRDFLAMKPLAFRALQQGLTSSDEDTALKASDQWFRAAGFGGYSKKDEPSERTTAEDVVRQLLNVSAENVQINVNVGADD